MLRIAAQMVGQDDDERLLPLRRAAQAVDESSEAGVGIMEAFSSGELMWLL